MARGPQVRFRYPAAISCHGAGHVLHHGAGEGPGGGDPAAQVVPGGHA